MSKPTPGEVLAVPMGPNDAGATTVRDYLIKLLLKVWDEQEAFSGKRPFGNSSWEFELYAALAMAGMIVATYDEDGYVATIDHGEGWRLIHGAINFLA